MRFNNTKTGKYKSKLESSVRKAMPRKKGLKVQYESTHIPYVIEHVYIPDFLVSLPNGRTFYIEAKGFFRAEDKRKMAAVKRNNPGLDIRMVFSSKSKRNAKWCERHGFPYAVGVAPDSWFE